MFYGDEAVKHLTMDMKDYGITKDELKKQFDHNDEQSKDNLCVFILHNVSAVVSGEKVKFTPYDTPYFGFYYEENDKKALDLVNMNSGNYGTFKNVKE